MATRVDEKRAGSAVEEKEREMGMNVDSENKEIDEEMSKLVVQGGLGEGLFEADEGGARVGAALRPERNWSVREEAAHVTFVVSCRKRTGNRSTVQA